MSSLCDWEGLPRSSRPLALEFRYESAAKVVAYNVAVSDHARNTSAFSRRIECDAPTTIVPFIAERRNMAAKAARGAKAVARTSDSCESWDWR